MEGKIRLLYVEDDRDWAVMIREVLAPKGFLVEIAVDGEEALKMFRENPPDMVLLDIEVPGRNGWELICDFKQEQEAIPVIFYSSFYQSSRLTDAFGVGAEDFISKSSLPEELSDRLHAFYIRAQNQRGKDEVLVLSDRISFQVGTKCLMIDGKKVFMKLNEAKLLHLLAQHIECEVSKEYLCEGIWGKGMYNATKCEALKILVCNLRKILEADDSLKICNKRWGGYYLVRI